MAPTNAVIQGRVMKKQRRKTSISSALAGLAVTATYGDNDRNNIKDMETFEVTPKVKTIYDIKTALLEMRESGKKIIYYDHDGKAYPVTDYSMTCDQLSCIIAELETELRNLATRIRYHSTRFSMTTRSQQRFAKTPVVGFLDKHFLLLHQKELQDGKELLYSLQEEAEHAKRIELRDQQFDKTCVTGLRRRGSISV